MTTPADQKPTPDRSARVFILQRVRDRTGRAVHDFSEAQRYGEIRFILDTEERNPANLPDLRDRIARALTDGGYDPEVDYLIPIGDPVAMAVLGGVVADDYGMGSVGFLRHSRRGYSVVVVEF